MSPAPGWWRRLFGGDTGRGAGDSGGGPGARGRTAGAGGGERRAAANAGGGERRAAANAGGDIALTVVQDGKRRDVTVRELAVGTKLAGDALLQVLVEKGLVTHEEVTATIRRITEERYRAGEPPPSPGP